MLDRGIHGERDELEDALEATRQTFARLAPLSNDGARSPGVHRRQAAATPAAEGCFPYSLEAIVEIRGFAIS